MMLALTSNKCSFSNYINWLKTALLTGSRSLTEMELPSQNSRFSNGALFTPIHSHFVTKNSLKKSTQSYIILFTPQGVNNVARLSSGATMCGSYVIKEQAYWY